MQNSTKITSKTTSLQPFDPRKSSVPLSCIGPRGRVYCILCVKDWLKMNYDRSRQLLPTHIHHFFICTQKRWVVEKNSNNQSDMSKALTPINPDKVVILTPTEAVITFFFQVIQLIMMLFLAIIFQKNIVIRDGVISIDSATADKRADKNHFLLENAS